MKNTYFILFALGSLVVCTLILGIYGAIGWFLFWVGYAYAFYENKYCFCNYTSGLKPEKEPEKELIKEPIKTKKDIGGASGGASRGK
jgi:hypothetical protein